MRGCLRFLIITGWLLGLACGVAQAATSVVIVSSERSPAYAEAAEALIVGLERNGLSRYDMLQQTLPEFERSRLASPKLFVALGTEAALALAKAELQVPVLSALLPRSSFERVLAETKRRPSAQFSVIYLDQPLSRQLDLIHLALPAAKHLGVLWGPDSKPQASALKTLAQARGLDVADASVTGSEHLFVSLKRVLETADVLLGVPDPLVFNSNSIQNILLSSFRAAVPMVGFSPAYVRAGALFALYATPAQIGQQAATLASRVVQNKGPLPEPVYSQDFTVAVNEHVARALGLRLDAAVLTTRLRSLEATK